MTPLFTTVRLEGSHIVTTPCDPACSTQRSHLHSLQALIMHESLHVSMDNKRRGPSAQVKSCRHAGLHVTVDQPYQDNMDLIACAGSAWRTYALGQQISIAAAELAPAAVREPEPILSIALLVCDQPAGQLCLRILRQSPPTKCEAQWEKSCKSRQVQHNFPARTSRFQRASLGR